MSRGLKNLCKKRLMLKMAEYIEREALIKHLTFAGAMCGWGLYLIKDTPAADVAPVRHGEWVWGGFDGKGYPVWCSECGIRFIGVSSPAEWLKYPEHQYCGNCGTKMGGASGSDEDKRIIKQYLNP